MTDDQLSIIENVKTLTKMGLFSEDSIAEMVADDQGFDIEADDPWLLKVIKKIGKQHQKDSLNWDHPTDPEKLKLVFDQLCIEGILALHNYGHENSDLFPVVNDVIQSLKEENYDFKIIGCCGYHYQDLDILINQEPSLCIGFHTLLDDNDPQEKHEKLKIGHRIVELLKQNGLITDWNGDLTQKICIENFIWNKIYVDEDDLWDQYEFFDLIDQL